MVDTPIPTASPADADIPLERDLFCRTLISELAGTMETSVGTEQAAEYISMVGRNMGYWINGEYKKAMGTSSLDRTQVAEALVDLKARINGTFELESDEDDTLTYTNTRCPFEDRVEGHVSMCMMTSNVFGVIAANNLGYAKVELQETIAKGDGGCRVKVHLDQAAAADKPGREYFD